MMNKILNYKNQLYKVLLFFGFLLWVFLVYKNVQLYMFNNDEIWAWNIAHDLSFYEIIQLMHYEGHSFLWYMIIKPFTLLADKIPALFPEILKWINLTFLAAAMFLMWMCSPFNIFLKLLITCTSPFVVTYALLARPYGLLILLLFIIAMQYKNRMKHPLFYAVLLFLLISTCWNGLIGGMFLGGFFLYDLYKENKDNILCSKFIMPAFIICSSFLMLVIEWFPVYTPTHMKYFGTLNVFCDFFIPSSNIKFYDLLSVIIFGPMLQLVALIQFTSMKNKRFLLFGAYIFYSMFIFYLLIAPGRYHHLYFIYIYFLVTYWMLLENSEEFKNNKLNFYSTTAIIALISILYLIPFREPHMWFIGEEEYNQGVERIKEIIPRGSRVFFVIDDGAMALAQLKNYYDMRSQYNHKIPSLTAYQRVYQDYYVRPEDIYVREGETAYYLVPALYIRALDIAPLFDKDYCEKIDDVYVVCTLKGKNPENNE